MGSYLRVNLLGPGPRLTKKTIYRAAVSRKLRNTALQRTAINMGYLSGPSYWRRRNNTGRQRERWQLENS